MIKNPERTIALVGLGLFLVWMLAPEIAGLMYEFHSDPRLQELANFGDSFAVFNGLISSLALAAIAAAIFIQAEQLRVQKEEVSRTIQNLERQEEIDDLRFTIELAPVLQRLLLDELRNMIGNDRVTYNEWKFDPESTAIVAELEELRPRRNPRWLDGALIAFRGGGLFR